MTVYLIYFLLIIVVPTFFSSIYKNKKKAQLYALRVLIVLLYLILALKGTSVGNDIETYKSWYETTKSIPFNDYSYCYMERGYILLMKLFTRIGFSFQLFTAVLYLIILYPIYLLIKRYSPDVMVSVMTLYCLNYFVFICSGLRQAIAMSLCVYAYIIACRSEKKYLLISLIIVILSSFIHKSALLFSPVLLMFFFPKKAFIFVISTLALMFVYFKPSYFISINEEYELSKYTYEENLTLGLMFVFEVLMLVFYIVSIIINHINVSHNRIYWQLGMIILYGLILLMGTNGSILMRSASYEMIFLSLTMPIAIKAWEQGLRSLFKVIYIITLFGSLYYLILLPSTLNIVPYTFFFK